MRFPRKTFAGAALTALLVLLLAWLGIRPRNDRDWHPYQQVLAHAEFQGDSVVIRDLRNFRFAAEGGFTPGYEDRTLRLQDLDSLWFVLSPFSEWKGPAHTMLSFGFGSEYVTVSIEARKEAGEAYSPWKGLLKRYELMYVVGDERDLVGLRTEQYGDDVYLYPVRATPEQARALFLEMMQEANALYERPKFYNSILSACGSGIARHVNRIAGKRAIPLSYKVLLPAYSDELLMDLGLIETDLPLPEARAAHRINGRAAGAAGREDFSRIIRGTGYSTSIL